MSRGRLKEPWNTAFLRVLLKKTGGYTGISGILDTGRPGPTIAIRADLDAVPVQESSVEEHEAVKGNYVSEIPGVMHACGHDAHTSILLAVAEWAVRNKEHLVGKYKFIFQPAEEGVRGGLAPELYRHGNGLQ